MAKIRRLNYFDKPKLKELIAFLKTNNHNHFLEMIKTSFLGYVHNFLPLKYKFLDESYLMTKRGQALGLITVNTFSGNPEKVNISQLLFLENAYEVAQQLIEYVVSQYGGMGANTFYVLIDDIHNELAQVFINNCGFRQCSCEQIWEVPKISFKRNNTLKYRRFKKSDVKEVADIYNDSVLTHFRPTLNRTEKEFEETLCSGLKYLTEYRYVIEDNLTSRIIAYFKISTPDDENYTIDFNYSNGYNVDFNSILYWATREILKRKRRFKLFVKSKNYINTNNEQKEFFESSGFKCHNTKLLLTKDFFQHVKEYDLEKKFSIVGGLNNSPTFRISEN